jgi:4-hydroxy-tetrahydrodipicolinate synthase
MTEGSDFHGVFSALATPFDPDGRVDVAALRRSVGHQLEEGIAGIVPCGSTGEFTSLSAEERRLVAEVVLSEVDGRVPVIPQTGALTTAEAVSLSRHAASLGAAAVLCVPPYYAPVSKSELVDYYDELVAAVDVPVAFYNIPWASNVVLTAAEIAELAQRTGIGLVKDSGGDIETMTSLIQEHGESITTFVGWDAFALYAFGLGARASILGAAAFMPARCAELLAAIEQGRHEEAAALWARTLPVLNFIGDEGYVAGVKAAADYLGVPMGIPRRPFAPLSEASKERLHELLRQADLAPVQATAPGA